MTPPFEGDPSAGPGIDSAPREQRSPRGEHVGSPWIANEAARGKTTRVGTERFKAEVEAVKQ